MRVGIFAQELLTLATCYKQQAALPKAVPMRHREVSEDILIQQKAAAV
jgi:hypothetical protein